ncbi:MAG: ExbD/TolR family protein [Bacteroidota bacterium]
MAKRDLPEINAGSMADIAFLLLIFFLVATTMDIDSGLSRKLPPMPEEEQQEQENDINERNILVVLVNKDDQLMVEGEVMDIMNLREKTKEFIANPADRSDLPEKELKQIEFFGEVPVSKQVISLQNDNGTTYGMYIKVQNELIAAYNELRNELSMQKFGVLYDDLDPNDPNDDAKIQAIRSYYPQRISEAEPKMIGE